MNRRQSWSIIFLFCILIFGFAAATLLKPEKQYSETENRTLQTRPALRLAALASGEFEEDYEDYLTDQFVVRDAWIGIKTNVERALLRTESKDIYFAEDGYLIEKHTGVFTTDTAMDNIRLLGQFAAIYEEKFGPEHMTFMVAPNAVDILRDKLPAFASPYDEEKYLEKIREALPEGTWFDASAVLREHSGEEIYYRTDHHWETLAAFYVYQAWAENQGYKAPEAEDYEIETVTDRFEGTIQSKLGIRTKTDTIEIYRPIEAVSCSVRINGGEETTDSIYEDSALDTKSKYDIFFGGNYAEVEITTDAGTGRRILVVKDSYAHCFVPFMLQEFDQITMLDIRYYNQTLGSLIEDEDYTDFLFLYNAAGFAEDTSIGRLLY